MITCWNGFSPECGVVVFYVISQNFITYLPHQIQLRLRLNWFFSCMVWCPQILNKRGCKVTIVALVWNDIQHFLFYVDQDKHVCDSSKMILFPHILQEFLLLLRLGFAPWAVSPDVDLSGVFKQCQKKPEAYYKGLPSTITISLYLKSRGGNQATPIAIAFRSWLLWYFRRSMLPLQLWIHFSKSLEISHGEDRAKEKVICLFSVQLKRGDVEL